MYHRSFQRPPHSLEEAVMDSATTPKVDETRPETQRAGELPEFRAIIGSDRPQSTQHVAVIDPSSGEPFARTAACDAGDVDAAVQVGREAQQPWADLAVR